MKRVHILAKAFLLTGVSFLIGACTNDFIEEGLVQEEPQVEQPTRHTVPMVFEGNVVGFDQPSGQSKVRGVKGATSSWKNGDKVFITFYNGSTVIPGVATYSSTDGWSVTYDGNLEKGNGMRCEARHFVNFEASNTSPIVYLNANSEIYEDINGKYDFVDGSLTVQATMSPKTGRIRFTGKSGETIYIKGFSYYNTFSTDNNSFTTSSALVKTAVSSNGSTPYIYAAFEETDYNIGLISSTSAFTRTCSADMLKTGDSGYMAIPTESAHGNWRTGLYIKAKGVEFKMIPVAGYTEGFFLIGETEVTEALYNTVNGTTSTSMIPVDNLTYATATTFCEKITAITHLKCGLPSTEQWKYAAMGGNKSKGFTYAGSNDPNEVAWYSANASSKQIVKTKAPNELGIYDMSGNVSEIVSDPYKNGSYYYLLYRGGSYKHPESKITVQSGEYNSNYSYTSSNAHWAGVGFRLMMTCE